MIKKIFIFILAIIPIVIALGNIWAKSVGYHVKVDPFFVKNNDNYEKYLEGIHLTYNITYENVSKLLNRKAFYTKLSYIFTIILFIKLF